MFGIGSTELIIILVVALLVLGPKKLPEMARSLGKGLAEFRRMSNDVKRTIDLEVDRADEEEKKKKAKKDLYPEGEEAKKAEAEKTQEPEKAAADSGSSDTSSGDEKKA
ncbi:MAG: Sec-independent protein translocase protein TatB [Desulfovibrionales bacterium]